MKSNDEWVNLVKGILRAEMTRRGMTYEMLAATFSRSPDTAPSTPVPKMLWPLL